MSLSHRSSVLIAGGIVALLIALLLPLPRPVTPSIQPWRGEMLAAIMMIAMSIWMYCYSDVLSVDRLLGTPAVRLLLFSLLGFIIWSGLSALWADWAGPVAHHTLAWSIYLSVLVITLVLLGARKGPSALAVAIALCSFILGALCLIDYASVVDFTVLEGLLRIRYGKYAELLVTILPFLFAITLYARSKAILVSTAAAWLLGWSAVMLSLSKGAFLSGIAGHGLVIAGCLLFSTKRLRKRTTILAGIWIAVTIAVQAFSSSIAAIPSTAEYISGTADPTRSTSMMRVFTWQVAAEMAARHWTLGVGGDNFGAAFNSARANWHHRMAAGAPEVAEDYAVERAHNEPLQIMAELGLVGIVLIALAFGTFLVLVIKQFLRDGLRLSPVLWGALAGMAGFACSSLLSSFSFRAIQNGIALFLMFAVALHEIVKGRSTPPTPLARWSVPMLGMFTFFAVLTLVYAGVKLASEYQFYQAERTEDPGAAAALYRRGLQFDPDNAHAHLRLGSVYARENDHDSAAVSIRHGIDRGLGVTMTYALLAKHQRRAGDADAAANTFAEALNIFPRSVYLLVAYAAFLEDAGQRDEAARQLSIAQSIDLRQAKGWQVLIRDGGTAAFYTSRRDEEVAPPGELSPYNAVLQYLER